MSGEKIAVVNTESEEIESKETEDINTVATIAKVEDKNGVKNLIKDFLPFLFCCISSEICAKIIIPNVANAESQSEISYTE